MTLSKLNLCRGKCVDFSLFGHFVLHKIVTRLSFKCVGVFSVLKTYFFYLDNTVLKLRVIPQDLGQCNEYCCKQATFGHIYTGDTAKLTTVQTV